MAGEIRLFEKVDGLLVQVSPDEADERRANRRVSRVSLAIDVLWTAEEEAQRAAEEAAALEAKPPVDEAAETDRAKRASAAKAKLEKLGVTPEDLRALLDR